MVAKQFRTPVLGNHPIVYTILVFDEKNLEIFILPIDVLVLSSFPLHVVSKYAARCMYTKASNIKIKSKSR